MSNRKIEAHLAEEDVQQILEHLRRLDGDSLVDASHDMDRALQGQGHSELPLWLRGFSKKAIQQARCEMLNTFSSGSKKDATSKH